MGAEIVYQTDKVYAMSHGSMRAEFFSVIKIDQETYLIMQDRETDKRITTAATTQVLSRKTEEEARKLADERLEEMIKKNPAKYFRKE